MPVIIILVHKGYNKIKAQIKANCISNMTSRNIMYIKLNVNHYRKVNTQLIFRIIKLFLDDHCRTLQAHTPPLNYFVIAVHFHVNQVKRQTL